MAAASRPPIEVHAGGGSLLGMPVARFLHDYWQRHPLLVRQALPGYRAPLAPEDLAGLACEEGVLARLVRHDRRRDRFSLRSGPFTEAEFPALGTRDWTLLVQDMDKWDADVRALLDHFRFLPAWRVDDVMISFAVPGGSVGAHVDQYDVFLVQAQGHRRWQIDAGPNPPRDFRPDAELKLLQRFAPTHDWVLAPGDLLYLPPGVPHHGVAEDACMTFSIGMRAPAQAELAVDWAEAVAAALPEEARYGDPGLAPPADAWEIDGDAFARLDAALAPLRAADPALRREWFGRFITRYRSAASIAPPPRVPAWAKAEAALAAGGRLLRHPFARTAWAAAGKRGQATLFVDGQAWPMATRDARALAADEALDGAALGRLGAPARTALAALLASGHYRLQSARRRR